MADPIPEQIQEIIRKQKEEIEKQKAKVQQENAEAAREAGVLDESAPEPEPEPTPVPETPAAPAVQQEVPAAPTTKIELDASKSSSTTTTTFVKSDGTRVQVAQPARSMYQMRSDAIHGKTSSAVVVQKQEVDANTIKWFRPRSNGVDVQLESVSFTGIPPSIEAEADPIGKVLLGLLAEVIELREKTDSLEKALFKQNDFLHSSAVDVKKTAHETAAKERSPVESQPKES